MKLVHITTYPSKGKKHVKGSGVASYTKNLVTNMPIQKDDKVYVLCDMINGKREVYTEDGMTIIRCFSRSPRFLLQLRRELKKIKPDVVHIQQELALFGNVLTAYLLQWLLWLSRSSPLVITLHGVVDLTKVDKNFVKENNSKLPTWLVKLAFLVIYRPLVSAAHYVIVHEAVFRRVLIEQYKAQSHKVGVIPHGVESMPARTKQDACARLSLDATRQNVLFMGYLTGYKGLDLLIEGFSQYAHQNPNAFLVIGAGKHPKLEQDETYLLEYKRLQDKAKALLSPQQYRWIGFIPEDQIADYYCACDVSVYPYTISMSSSGPMSSFAIGFERPFLASDAFAEVLDKRLLFNRSPKSLSDKLAYFFDHADQFKTLSTELKQTRSWRQVSAKTYRTYREAAV